MMGSRLTFACGAMLGVAILAVPPALSAQSNAAWRATLPAKAEALDSTPFGHVLVQFKTGLLAVDPGSGGSVWSRTDATAHSLVTGTPYAVLTTSGGQTVAELETGRDAWRLASLGLSSVKGVVDLAPAGLLLVYGPTSENAHTLVAARVGSGEVVWRQTGLYKDAALAGKASRIEYRDHLIDTDGTVVLDPTEAGLLRLDLGTGEVRWRIAQDKLDSGGKAVTLFSAGDVILVAYDRKLLAIDRDQGSIRWSRSANFPSPVVQAANTRYGVLVRGAYNIGNNNRPAWDPYLAMLDPATGGPKWTNEKTKFKGRSEFLEDGDAAVIALEDGIATYDLSSGQVRKTIAMSEFDGGESACCLERTAEGGLLVWSSQNMRLFDRAGERVYSVYLKAPGASFLAKAAAVGAMAASGAGSGPAKPGFHVAVTPRADTAWAQLTSRFKATKETDGFMYVFTEEERSSPDHFALVRIDKTTGRDTGRVRFADRSPTFLLEPVSGVVVAADDRVVYGLRYDGPAKP